MNGNTGEEVVVIKNLVKVCKCVCVYIVMCAYGLNGEVELSGRCVIPVVVVTLLFGFHCSNFIIIIKVFLP